MTVIEFLDQKGYHYKIKGKEAILDICPFCKHPHSKDRFSVNLETGAYICNRQDSCGARGVFKLDNIEKKNILEDEKKILEFTKDDFTTLTSTQKKYLESRGISYETCKYARVLSKNGAICFFNTNKNGKIVGVKYRTIPKDGEKKKIWAHPGSEMTLLNWDKVPKDTDTLYIVEGEIDMLSLLEIGIKNVVSVPNGAGSTDWIEIHYEWLQKFKKLILMLDNDKAGEEGIKHIIKRLKGSNNSLYKVDMIFYKDANEILCDEDGRTKLKNILNNIVEIEEKQVEDITNYSGQIKDKSFSLGDRALNALTGGGQYGAVFVITGNPGSGKSILLNNVMCNLINDGHKIFTMQGEFTPTKFKQNMMRILSRPEQIETYYNKFKNKEFGIVKADIEEKINKWLKGKLFIHTSQVPTKTELLGAMEYSFKKHGVRIFVIDNLMTINLESNSSDKYEKQKELFLELQDFAKKKQVLIFVVAHPRKNSITALDEADMGVVSGTSDIMNLANYGVFLKRLSDKEMEKLNEQGIFATVGAKNLKDREYGDINLKAYWSYEPRTSRFIDYKYSEESKNKKYSWEITLEKVPLPFVGE